MSSSSKENRSNSDPSLEPFDNNNEDKENDDTTDGRTRKSSAGISARRNFGHSLSTSGAAGGGDNNEGYRSGNRSRNSSTNEPDRPRSRRTSTNIPPVDTAGTSSSGAMTEDKVAQEAEEVVQSFMVSAYQLECRHELGEMGPNEDDHSPYMDTTPNIPELQEGFVNPFNQTTQIGRRLAHLGDEFQDRYQAELDELVNMLMPRILQCSPGQMLSEAYADFKRVALRIFEGGVNWGRIISLMCFGYRMAVALVRQGLRGFISSVVQLVVKFIIGERIAQWIAQNGGWIASNHYQIEPEGALSVVANTFFQTLLLASAIILIWKYMRR